MVLKWLFYFLNSIEFIIAIVLFTIQRLILLVLVNFSQENVFYMIYFLGGYFLLLILVNKLYTGEFVPEMTYYDFYEYL